MSMAYRSNTLGILKCPAPDCGALASAACGSMVRRSRSSRSVAVSSASYSTCAMGSTPVGVQFIQLVDVGQDAVQVGGHAARFLFGQLQVRQIGDVSDFLFGDLHAVAFLRATL